MSDLIYDELELGYTGSRQRAFERGDIMDVTPYAKQVGFRWPLAITRAV